LKKIFAISLLIIHLFNLAGYYLLFNYFIQRSDIKAIQQLDQNLYHDKELAEIKIPLHLPYLTDMNEFERVDGDIEFNGIHYNYVKRKVSNDTLYILCQPNYDKTKLANEKTNYTGNVNDAQQNKKCLASSAKKNIYSSECNRPGEQYYIDNSFTVISLCAQLKSSKLPTVFYPLRGKPPEHNCSSQFLFLM
jgi:hypothetical protein